MYLQQLQVQSPLYCVNGSRDNKPQRVTFATLHFAFTFYTIVRIKEFFCKMSKLQYF